MRPTDAPADDELDEIVCFRAIFWDGRDILVSPEELFDPSFDELSLVSIRPLTATEHERELVRRNGPGGRASS